MQNIIIDEEFRSLLPALDDETYKSLEADLIQNGCRDALVVWNGVLIDGYNRYEICTEHNIGFVTIDKEFASREEVLIWIISNQVSRRNLTPIQLSYFRGLHYRAQKKITANERGKNQYSGAGEVESQNATQPKNPSTARFLAGQYKVSRDTILRDSKVAEAIDALGEMSPDAKKMILSGEAKLDKKELAELCSKSKEDIAGISGVIEKGAYEKKAPEPYVAKIPGTPAEMIIAGMRPLDAAISKLSGLFSSVYAQIKKNADKAAIKTALRGYIDALEALHGQL